MRWQQFRRERVSSIEDENDRLRICRQSDQLRIVIVVAFFGFQEFRRCRSWFDTSSKER